VTSTTFQHRPSVSAASAAEKRDYEESFMLRQHYFLLSLKTVLTSHPLVSAAVLVRKRGRE
ncbi:hypothetical protein, partial [Paraburkholderia megapolitana]|uniref:hypothetical protein n=1 Tax=Paraburkholderia megapolitana TaxID=420953 RepID=UPI001C43673B